MVTSRGIRNREDNLHRQCLDKRTFCVQITNKRAPEKGTALVLLVCRFAMEEPGIWPLLLRRHARDAVTLFPKRPC